MKGLSSPKKPLKKVIYTVLGTLFVIGIGLLLPRLYHVVGGVVMYPFHVVTEWYQTSEDTLPALLREKVELEQEIKDLKNELVVASGQNLTLERLREENSRLRALLGSGSDDRVVAAVIGRPNELPYDLLQIDVGRADGIEEGALVLLGEDRLVGSVMEVRNNYSFVELFTTPGVQMTGFISGPDVIATIEGVGGGVARARVPQGIPLEVGNLVYVPSMTPALFGLIDVIENRPSQPEQFGYITLPFSLQSLYWVGVSDRLIEPASIESIQAAKESIVSQRWLVEEANTETFEELLATSSPTTSETVRDE